MVFRTHAKIWQSGFFWPTMYEDTKDLSKDVGRVRGTEITMLEMLCHSPTIFRYNSLMSGELITWDHL